MVNSVNRWNQAYLTQLIATILPALLDLPSSPLFSHITWERNTHARTHLLDLSFNLAHLIPSPVTQLPSVPPPPPAPSLHANVCFAQDDARRA